MRNKYRRRGLPPKMLMADIIPAILEKEIEAVEQKIHQVEGLVEQIHIDIVDGKFADNKTIGVEELLDLDGGAELTVQLITEEPIELTEQCAEAGVTTVIGQIELMESQSEFVKAVKEKEMRVGLALDLKTAVDFLEEEIVGELDQVLLMAVAAGFSGQEFDQRVLDKVRLLRQEIGFKGDIWVDGGVNEQTVGACVEAGANLLAVGSALWEAENVVLKLKQLQRLAQRAQAG